MVPGRMNDEEVTVFDSTGLAIQDVATATRVSQEGPGKGSRDAAPVPVSLLRISDI